MKELLIMAKSLGGGGSEVALIELINALPEEHYNVTLVLLDLDSEYAYRLKKRVNIVQLTFNSSFAKSLVSMYAFPAKVLKKLSVNYYITLKMRLFWMAIRLFIILKFLHRNLNALVITVFGQMVKRMSGFRLLKMALL